MKIEDRELVAQVLDGQVDDFRVLVERHQQSIFRFASGMLGRPEEAQDVTQETFLAAFVNLSRFDPTRASFPLGCSPSLAIAASIYLNDEEKPQIMILNQSLTSSWQTRSLAKNSHND